MGLPEMDSTAMIQGGDLSKMDKLPVFVLGCDRSGTSLLHRIFDSHGHIACPTETKFIFQFVKVFETYQSVTGLKNMGFTEDQILQEMQRFIRYFLDEYARRRNKCRWVEKTTHNVNCAPTIDRIFFGQCLYVAIVRHGLDVAYSFETLTHDKFTVIDKYRTDGADTALAGIRHWIQMNRQILEFRKTAGSRMMLIRYEDLTTRPEEILRSVCDFIGEPWDSRMLDYNRQDHDPGWEDPNSRTFPEIIRNSNKYQNWPREVQQRLVAEAREVLDLLGYTYPDEAVV